ncbi:MAG: hypothetical protein M0C28_01420 [Candidatus Moduliflexus flocculans]|nr:hypothetical protein [Candidatus Moduliflexus flocculans]
MRAWDPGAARRHGTGEVTKSVDGVHGRRHPCLPARAFRRGLAGIPARSRGERAAAARSRRANSPGRRPLPGLPRRREDRGAARLPRASGRRRPCSRSSTSGPSPARTSCGSSASGRARRASATRAASWPCACSSAGRVWRITPTTETRIGASSPQLYY